MTNTIVIESVNPFSVQINKLNVTECSPARHSAPHIHDLCEIYVNLSGNVSFIVEKNVYSLQAGDIIITKPYEYHHCIYHDSSDHLHYWMMFSPHENPELFDFFLERERGTDNLIRLPEEILDKFLSLCEKLTSINPAYRISALSAFFEIISYIAKGIAKYNVQEVNQNLPQNVSRILTYINKNFASIKNINDLASTFHISIATLERYFKKHLSMTPKRYLEDKKLSNACMLLRQNYSVTDACFESGFDDYSHFITIFKRNFHITPLKYKKNL
ncbi:MAG: helix-turn-helix transcriptional regulator [Clostridia bacterium]|nr:helix-turn-helix transcriptional regulator [Clostridia bacterium]